MLGEIKEAQYDDKMMEVTMETIQMISNPTMSSILNRRSIQKYKQESVGMSELATIMEAALQAPTGRNEQSCDIIMV